MHRRGVGDEPRFAVWFRDGHRQFFSRWPAGLETPSSYSARAYSGVLTFGQRRRYVAASSGALPLSFSSGSAPSLVASLCRVSGFDGHSARFVFEIRRTLSAAIFALLIMCSSLPVAKGRSGFFLFGDCAACGTPLSMFGYAVLAFMVIGLFLAMGFRSLCGRGFPS